MDTRIFALTLFLLLFYKPVELHRVVPIFFVDLLIKINIPQFPSPYVLVTMVDYVPVTKFNSLKKKTHCCFASYIYAIICQHAWNMSILQMILLWSTQPATRPFPHLAESAPPASRSTSPVFRFVFNCIPSSCGQSTREN